MKICYLSDATSSHTRKWCSFFLSKGYEVIVISLGDAKIEGCKVFSFGVKDFAKKSDFNKLFSYTTKIKKIRKIIEEEKPDIIHAHYATSYGVLASMLKIHPYILSFWGSDVYDFPNRSILHRTMLKYNIRSSDYIMSTSENMKREIEKYTKKDIIVTPFGVDINKFKPLKLERDNNFTVGSIKSFYKIYGLDYLIKGFKIFIDRTANSNAKLLLAGKGIEENNLKRLVRELYLEKNVEFLGFLNVDKVVETFNKIDVAVFPSESESFGVAAVEAQACGVPTIVSNVGGLPEATNPGKSSIVIEPKNEFEIAKALEDLYKNKEKRLEMGTNGREYVLEKYNIDDNFNYVDSIYRKIIEEKE
ncbi:glycosyltransferase family 4 protein [Miniphocaeibacter massiliensis]|uniref:glycosyltransferase family 4 protein n=1 Tax=Miniphocaeibacter massiliensis TaxID=2041841 RepID=UPI000C1B8721|nr:glycosyltransferase family 4 protein [Miniphocaeibacter massiliensis]